jgi:hypothetical protein
MKNEDTEIQSMNASRNEGRDARSGGAILGKT